MPNATTPAEPRVITIRVGDACIWTEPTEHGFHTCVIGGLLSGLEVSADSEDSAIIWHAAVVARARRALALECVEVAS